MEGTAVYAPTHRVGAMDSANAEELGAAVAAAGLVMAGSVGVSVVTKRASGLGVTTDAAELWCDVQQRDTV